ncbi:hypothetical protein ASG22_08940 [Chryseobacterium sp. Leaf405]|uniref:hypothetical protein n=1 Tax=Chryseobacterium sp. Leaf405 TaxID=1736367 RepID=UPI00070063C8|nr:hypothetical protein [Chryseobacterium sp. Leaf405]KQT24132.1 hypothetical protein ASG22_08940 [Chryseobacterium sp. Leaf405]
MKKIVPLLSLLLGTTAYYAQVGVNTANPQATFEVTAKTTDGSKPEGIIIPKLTGDQIKSADTQYTTAQKGVMIYATSAVGTASIKTANITAEGYYYFDGLVWQKMGTGAYVGSTSVALNGNSFQRAALTGDAIATANSNATTVVGLQGRPVANTAPQTQDLLSFNGTSWAPASPTTLGIPKQIVSVSVAGTQNLFTTPLANNEPFSVSNNDVYFSTENYDPYNSWDGRFFTVPTGMQGTYTLNMQTGNSHTVSGSIEDWWVMGELFKSPDNGATWQRITYDVRSGLQSSDVNNGNILFWTGNLNAGDILLVKTQYKGNTNNIVIQGNLAIIKL